MLFILIFLKFVWWNFLELFHPSLTTINIMTAKILYTGIALSVAGLALHSPVEASGANEQLKKQMLSHVEKILIVDSVLIDKNDFFKFYRLQPSAGKILGEEELDNISVNYPDAGYPQIGFTNEFRDYLIWAQPDSTSYLRLVESSKLTDGKWSEPEYLSTVLNSAADEDDPAIADASFPFMLDDGVTLYFASNGPESLGGYDIFVATKDPSDGSFLKPRNIGMPFNSEYDDYMMAVDELTGVGWWVSDRNQIEDKLTLYIYELKESRENVDPADPDLMVYATLADWKSVLDEEDDTRRNELKNEIRAVRKDSGKAQDFYLPISGKKAYTSFSDFKSPKAAALMKKYLADSKNVQMKEKELKNLRLKLYKSAGDPKLKKEIQTYETSLRNDKKALKETLSEIYRMEK